MPKAFRALATDHPERRAARRMLDAYPLTRIHERVPAPRLQLPPHDAKAKARLFQTASQQNVIGAGYVEWVARGEAAGQDMRRQCRFAVRSGQAKRRGIDAGRQCARQKSPLKRPQGD